MPKKRGPKTDVLEALLKRVDGLEKRLQDENNPISPASPETPPNEQLPPPQPVRRNTIDSSLNSYSPVEIRPVESTQFQAVGSSYPKATTNQSALSFPKPSQTRILSEAVLNTFFARLHGKPFFILDEPSTRQRYRTNELPTYLSMAISALTTRYVLRLRPAPEFKH